MERLDLVNLRRTDSRPGLRASGDQVVDLDNQLEVMTSLRAEGKIGAIGLSSVTLDVVRRSLPVGVSCVQNAYSLVARDDEDVLRLCVEEGIAWVPYFPLGGGVPGMPKATDEPVVQEVAARLGVPDSQVGLAWLLHHAPNVLLIPGTSKTAHLEANLAVGAIAFDEETLAALDAVPSRSSQVSFG